MLVLLLVLPPLAGELMRERAAHAPVPVPPAGDYDVYVADWGYHTAVIIEQPGGWRLGPPGRETAPFVEVAWGDRRFYMASDYRPHALVITLLLPSDAVTYVAAWDAPPERSARPRALYHRTVGAETLRTLAASLEGSIVRDGAQGRAAPHAPATGYAGRFFPARGSYGWWDACNRWTVERLADAGLARGGRGVVFSGQVASHLVGFRRLATGGG